MEGSPRPPTALESLQRGQQQAKAGLDQLVAITNTIKALVLLVTSVFASFVEVFLRTQFGERYFTIPRFLLTLIGVPFLFHFVVPRNQMPAVAFSMMLYVVAALLQFRMILYRNLRGERWYSRSSGMSWGVWARLPKGDNLWVVSIVYEPLLCLVLAAALARTGYGILLFAGGIALAVQSYLEYRFHRERILDAVDAQIESKYIAEALGPQASVRKTQGYIVPAPQAWQQGFSPSEDCTVRPSVILEGKPEPTRDGGALISVPTENVPPTTTP
jgi:hypothetical protein